MRRIILFCLLTILTLPAFAQEESGSYWADVSWLNHVVTGGGTDVSNGLLQYLLFTPETLDSNRRLFDDFTKLSQEISQVYINQVVPELMDEMEKGLQDLREQYKNNPEILAQVNEAYRQYQIQKKESLDKYVDDRNSYSLDPAAILSQMKALAVNRKVYTGWSDAGNGLYAVTEVPRYADLKEDAKYSAAKITFADEDYYRWSLIDGVGREILPPQYGTFNAGAIGRNCIPEDGIMFLYKEDPDGSVHAGVVDYTGREIIPFIYDDHLYDVYHHQEPVPFEKDGKVGWVSVRTGQILEPFEYDSLSRAAYGWVVRKGDKCGFINFQTGRLVVPVKYKSLWDDGPEMLRFDGKVDVYDENGNLLEVKEVKE